MKTGIFGGTFDPVHMGHLILAESAYDNLGLDKVLMMPTPAPYHRSDKTVTSLEHRVNMLMAAIKGSDHLVFSDFELSLPGNTFTVRTLEEYSKAHPGEELYLIVGGDSLFSMENWYEPEKLFSLAVIASSKREGENRGASGSCLPSSDAVDLDGNGIDDRSEAASLHDEFLAQAEYLRRKYNARIVDVETPNIEISSSDIVKRIREGRSIRYLVPDRVADYIAAKGLYK